MTLTSALRHAAPEERPLSIARAQQLLEHARDETTDASLLAEIDALDADLESISETAQQREG